MSGKLYHLISLRLGNWFEIEVTTMGIFTMAGGREWYLRFRRKAKVN